MSSRLTLVSAPQDFALDVPSLTGWLNVVRDDEAGIVEDLGQSAQGYVETYTDRRLITQTWDLILPCFRPVIVLPYPPLQAVVSVTYLDLAGTATVLDPARYEVLALAGEFADPGEIRPAYLELWPETRPTWNAVTIRFRCGYGNAPEDVPAGLRKAIDRIAEENYRIRGITVSTAAGAREKPVVGGFSMAHALMPYRVLDAWWRED